MGQAAEAGGGVLEQQQQRQQQGGLLATAAAATAEPEGEDPPQGCRRWLFSSQQMRLSLAQVRATWLSPCGKAWEGEGGREGGSLRRRIELTK